MSDKDFAYYLELLNKRRIIMDGFNYRDPGSTAWEIQCEKLRVASAQLIEAEILDKDGMLTAKAIKAGFIPVHPRS